MQLTTVGKEIWRAARKAEQLEEAGAGDVTVTRNAYESLSW